MSQEVIDVEVSNNVDSSSLGSSHDTHTDADAREIEAVKVTKSGMIDKRTTVSCYNALRHGKYAKKISLKCDVCMFGKTGKCDSYLAGSVCGLKKELHKYIEESNGDRSLSVILDRLRYIHDMTFENYMQSLHIANMEGGVPDKIARQEAQLIIELSKLIAELSSERSGSMTMAVGMSQDQQKFIQIMQSVWTKKAMAQQP